MTALTEGVICVAHVLIVVELLIRIILSVGTAGRCLVSCPLGRHALPSLMAVPLGLAYLRIGVDLETAQGTSGAGSGASHALRRSELVVCG